jgi:hypothetical protein
MSTYLPIADFPSGELLRVDRLTQVLTLSQLGLTALEHDFLHHLLPALYLNKVATQTSDGDQRHA